MLEMSQDLDSLREEIKYLQDFKIKIESEYPKKFAQMDDEIKEEEKIKEKIARGEDISYHLKKLQDLANEWCVTYGYDVITDMDVIVKEIEDSGYQLSSESNFQPMILGEVAQHPSEVALCLDTFKDRVQDIKLKCDDLEQQLQAEQQKSKVLDAALTK